ncbi:MAG: hypothetical protein WAM94_08615 [Chromatiaceae bacterium]
MRICTSSTPASRFTPAQGFVPDPFDVDALLFDTDLPSTRAPRPFVLTDLDLIAAAALHRVLHRNALALYRPESDAAALPQS